jgi:hypothetical protein
MNKVARAFLLLAGLVVIFGVLAWTLWPRGSSHDVSGRYRFGTDLIVTAPQSSDRTAVPFSRAKGIIEHPYSRPAATESRLVLIGLARVSMNGGLSQGQSQRFDRRLAWVGVYEVRGIETSCPNVPGTAPPGFVIVPGTAPTNPSHYAVIVDAATGVESDWSEGVSGDICAHLAPAPPHS